MTKDEFASAVGEIVTGVHRWAGDSLGVGVSGKLVWRRSPTGDEVLDGLLLRLVQSNREFEYQEAVRFLAEHERAKEARRLGRVVAAVGARAVAPSVARGVVGMMRK